ncbi:DUF2892 domain-containing protein [Patescibacteria group bacterium]|nr:MAG: DUF2892 domain-containing protein [Patescibacteria group bacterium]
MTKNLNNYERLVRLALALIFGWLWLYAVSTPFAKVFFFVVAVGALWEAAVGSCGLLALLGVKKPSDRLSGEKLFLTGVLGVQLTLAWSWWHAGWEKATGTFLADLPKILEMFASKNPYPLFKNFLLQTALPNADTFGPLVQWGQLLVGLGLALAAAAIIYDHAKTRRLAYGVAIAALISGAVMNANFWLAAGWTGPATAGSNVMMFWPELILIYIWCKLYKSNQM